MYMNFNSVINREYSQVHILDERGRRKHEKINDKLKKMIIKSVEYVYHSGYNTMYLYLEVITVEKYNNSSAKPCSLSGKN